MLGFVVECWVFLELIGVYLFWDKNVNGYSGMLKVRICREY